MDAISRDALLDTFATYGRPQERWLVGAEFERHLLHADGRPLGYSEPRGIADLFDRFIADGWVPEREGEHVIAVAKDGASITLEPGGQFELSGAPGPDVQTVAREAWGFSDRLQQHLDGTDVTQVALGFTPFTPISDIGWVPKGRYKQMKSFLIQHGDLAHHMMKGTAAVQVSFDFADEADCARKVELAMRLAPLTVALFANSPYTEGRDNGFASFRGHIWTRTDNARTGLPDATEGFSFERWIDYLIDVPMMFRKQGHDYVTANGLTFRHWMDHGIDGVFPTWKDWETHLTQVFPEVRVKQQIEVRGADCVPLPLALSFVAMFEGLFYCGRTLDESWDLATDFASHGSKHDRFDAATRGGLEAMVGGRRLLDWGRDVVALAGRALGDCAPHDRRFLEPLEELVERGTTHGRYLVDQLGPTPTPEALIAAVGYHGPPNAWRPEVAAL